MFFQFFYLAEPPYVPFFFRKRSFEPNFYSFLSLLFGDKICPQRKDIGIIVLARKADDIERPSIKFSRTHRRKFVSYHILPFSRSSQYYSSRIFRIMTYYFSRTGYVYRVIIVRIIKAWPQILCIIAQVFDHTD